MTLFDQFQNTDPNACGPDCGCNDQDGSTGSAGEDPFPGFRDVDPGLEVLMDLLAEQNELAAVHAENTMGALSALSRIIEIQSQNAAVLAVLISQHTES